MKRQVAVYKLKDDAGEILDGTFYESGLQKIIKNDDVYRVEKILPKSKRKGLMEYFILYYFNGKATRKRVIAGFLEIVMLVPLCA